MSTVSFPTFSGERTALEFNNCGVRRFLPGTLLCDAVEPSDPAVKICEGAERFSARMRSASARRVAPGFRRRPWDRSVTR